MKFSETTAAGCRYGENAATVFGDYDIIWEDSEANYQGHASILGKKGGKYVFYEWWYGSCSGCDGWEADNKTNDEIEKEMKDTAMWFSGKKALKKWLEMLTGNPISNYNGGGLRSRIDAIRKELGMGPLHIPAPKVED